MKFLVLFCFVQISRTKRQRGEEVGPLREAVVTLLSAVALPFSLALPTIYYPLLSLSLSLFLLSRFEKHEEVRRRWKYSEKEAAAAFDSNQFPFDIFFPSLGPSRPFFYFVWGVSRLVVSYELKRIFTSLNSTRLHHFEKKEKKIKYNQFNSIVLFQIWFCISFKWGLKLRADIFHGRLMSTWTSTNKTSVIRLYDFQLLHIRSIQIIHLITSDLIWLNY